MTIFAHTSRSVVFLASLLIGMAAASIAPPEAPAHLPAPGLQHEPEDVVRIVIEALASNDEPFTDAGIATTFAFASPANRRNTGPLERFTRMVKGPVFGIMVDHREHQFSEIVQTGNRAYQMVMIRGAGDEQVIFAFRLGRQQGGEFDGMWMTEAVWPVASGDLREQSF